ncbi:hypothetical protein GCM10027454_05090 [Algoriphagus aestuariicola]|jgi:hypothetical protein
MLILLGLTACADTEDQKPDDQIPFEYYFKFKVDNQEYFYGFNEIWDQFNPKEKYEGSLTENVILYNSGNLYASVREGCGDQPERDCIWGVFSIGGNSPGTYEANPVQVIGTNEVVYVPFLNGNAKDGNLTVTIKKIDPIGRYVEASFSGQLYSETTREEVLKTIAGEFRAYYNPD